MKSSESQKMSRHEEWMLQALELAMLGKGRTAPNPCVGALLVRGGRIIGFGWHQKAGEAHAEVEAVRCAHRLGNRVAGSTLYVTLEPCSTHGKTPPCTDLIISQKIRQVVVGAVDPNPKHAGQGLTLLKKKGIEVISGVLEQQCSELNRDFNHWIVRRRPWVTVKVATGWDGRLTRPKREGQWLTSEASREVVQRLRAEHGAILIGAETARRDNPRLTLRGGWAKGRRQPIRVVWTRGGRLPANLHLMKDGHPTQIVHGLKFEQILDHLGEQGVTSLLVEGGGEVVGEVLRGGWANEICWFMAPLITGTQTLAVPFKGKDLLPESIQLEQIHCQAIEQDLFLRAKIKTRA